MTIGITPPRKSRSTVAVVVGGGGGEDTWRTEETAKKTTTRVWGTTVSVSVSLRSHFRSLLLLLLVFLFLAVVSVTTKNGDTQHTPPPADDTIAAAIKLQEAAAATLPPSNATDDDGGECDLFDGRWVYDEAAYPLYKESECRVMSEQSACEKYGRTDLRYQHWRWQPHGCDLPRFDAAKFLGKLRDKRLVFVGDSLNRNQWASMVCLIDTGAPELHTTMNSTGSLSTFKIHEYNASVDFYWSPLLVESNSDHPLIHRVTNRIVRAASINKHAVHWTGADVLVFNSFIWWRQHPDIKVLWGSFDKSPAEEGEGDNFAVYKVIGSLRAYELAVRTWADWLEFHVDRTRTKLFFMTMSPTHLRSHDWEEPTTNNTNHNCYGETEPIAASGEGQRRGVVTDDDTAFARAVEAEARRLGERGVAVRLVNVTRLSETRKDAHPSVHRRFWDPVTDEQRRDPSSYADCIHWCLPGVPDVWNQLLYAHFVS